MTTEEARALLASAELLHGQAEIEIALDHLAREIGARLEEKRPLVLTVMGGAVVFAGQLLPRLAFPLECDFLHATRYREALSGAVVHWRVEPEKPVVGRCVLVLDDILDEGVTLAAIKERLLASGAAEVWLAVLVEKEIGRAKPVRADFVGLSVPNRYVFGYGMDVKGLWRNLPAIYALRETAS
ncbi:MAG: hypoxanthine-guanine phosphoribosyltransferase [Rhodocyclaceae bacterium]|nr:hypoxanthine-guanine phosphoribosyltransferase [Rhodocyclaceae bacterium]